MIFLTSTCLSQLIKENEYMKIFSKQSIKHYFPFLLVALLVMLLFQSQWYRLDSHVELKEIHKEEIKQLGAKALTNLDVPVGALLIYGDSIIGKGYNTVKKHQELSGHAEINALNMAYAKYGDKFHQLDRNKLKLYSSFEPCEMCKGALVHYDIQQVYFEKNKSIFHQLKSTFNTLLYEWNKSRFNAHNLQEDLFMQHPEYPGKE